MGRSRRRRGGGRKMSAVRKGLLGLRWLGTALDSGGLPTGEDGPSSASVSASPILAQQASPRKAMTSLRTPRAPAAHRLGLILFPSTTVQSLRRSCFGAVRWMPQALDYCGHRSSSRNALEMPWRGLPGCAASCGVRPSRLDSPFINRLEARWPHRQGCLRHEMTMQV